MPDKQVPVAQRREWDFTEPRPLPAGWINNAFTGWNRKATIVWDDCGLALDIECPPPLDICHVYSPGSDAAFFCLEPVTHAVDAHNLAPGPAAHGLVVLAPGEALTVACDFNIREIG